MPYKPGIASMSLGRAWIHPLKQKLEEAAKAGFQGIEVFYEDLEYLAGSHGGETRQNLLQAAKDVRGWCASLGLDVICLQPFSMYEGLADRSQHDQRLKKLHLWFEIAAILQTDLILIPSNFMPADALMDDLDVEVRDLLEVAELGAAQSPPLRFAFEALAWGTHIDTWDAAWDVVERVNRPNFGTCIDTFNLCGRVWADPAAASGKTPNADEDLAKSIAKLVSSVDKNKVFMLQCVDAERMQSPLVEGHPWYEESQPARMSWSRNARVFPYEAGAYLPVDKVLAALFNELHYEGWVSLELFSRTMTDDDPNTPHTHAERGFASWRRLAREFALQ